MKAAFLIFPLAFIIASCAPSLPVVRATQQGREVQYALVRHSAPPVVFENGLGGQIEEWAAVWAAFSNETTLFAYNRPGYGESASADTPRDGKHIAEELRALLKGHGLEPPYVLVGHSFGGLTMQYYARAWPQEVKALVLVDTTHPEHFSGPGALSNQPDWALWVLNAFLSADQKAELYGIEETGREVLALPAYTNGPVIVLSAAKRTNLRSVPADYENQKRREVAALYSGSKQVWVDSGHEIPREKPEAVVEAIREALK